MLKRQYRLGSKTRIKFTKSFISEFFILRVLANNISYNRFAFVVSKKIDKRAVVRNKIKRIFRSCIESLFEEIKPGYDMLFIVKERAREAKKEEILSSLKKTLEKEKYLT